MSFANPSHLEQVMENLYYIAEELSIIEKVNRSFIFPDSEIDLSVRKAQGAVRGAQRILRDKLPPQDRSRFSM